MAHKILEDSVHTAAIARGEAHVAQMEIASAKRVLQQRQEQHRRSLSAIEKARFKLEAARQAETNAKKDLRQIQFVLRPGDVPGNSTIKTKMEYAAAQAKRRAAA